MAVRRRTENAQGLSCRTTQRSWSRAATYRSKSWYGSTAASRSLPNGSVGERVQGPLRDLHMHHPSCRGYPANQAFYALGWIAQVLQQAVQSTALPKAGAQARSLSGDPARDARRSVHGPHREPAVRAVRQDQPPPRLAVRGGGASGGPTCRVGGLTDHIGSTVRRRPRSGDSLARWPAKRRSEAVGDLRTACFLLPPCGLVQHEERLFRLTEPDKSSTAAPLTGIDGSNHG